MMFFMTVVAMMTVMVTLVVVGGVGLGKEDRGLGAKHHP